MRSAVLAVVIAVVVVLSGCIGTEAPAGDATPAAMDRLTPTATPTATDGPPAHTGCQPGEIEKDGSCQPVLGGGGNAGIFDATSLAPITTAETAIDGTPGYLARPAADGSYPAVIMIHEWWGLNDNIRHMADILAGHGYVVFAVDLYDGEVATNASRAAELSGAVRANPKVAVEKMSRAVTGLRAMPYSTEQVASLGWCFGGGQSLRLSLSDAELNATVIYYGSLVTDAETLQRIDGPVLGIFGSEDRVVPVEDVRAFEAALSDLGVAHEIHVYEGAPHAFANPSGERFHPEATQDAWTKTLGFLGEHLQSPEE